MELKEIHKDERRAINIVEGVLDQGREFSIIKLNKGKAIGGCIHSEPENFCIIKGIGEYWYKDKGKTIKVGYIKGEHAEIPPETPHAFVAKEESIIIEWGIKPEDKGRKDVSMRNELNKLNDLK